MELVAPRGPSRGPGPPCRGSIADPDRSRGVPSGLCSGHHGAEVIAEAEVGDKQVCQEEKVLLTFPAANRDPERFHQPDEVMIDRQKNRHIAFGLGIHRCLGSNLAQMELQVALERWLERIPLFRLAPCGDVTWTGGHVSGPRSIPVLFPEATG